jgi:hypothetical protein
VDRSILKSSMPYKKSEVDLRVAQELKNNQDFIYQTNQTLQGLSHGLVALSLQHERVIAKFDSEKKDILIDFENICDKVNKSLHEINQRIGDLESKYNKDIEDIKFVLNTAIQNCITQEVFNNEIRLGSISFNKLDSTINKHINESRSNNQHIHSTIKSEIQKVREDLTPIIPEVDPVKKAIQEVFEVFKVDFDGLVREISILKKAVAYDEKKFENVYTLINRLKESA